MKYEDLDKTQDLFDIPENYVPSPILNIEMEGATKKDLGEEEKEVKETNIESNQETPKKEVKKKKDKKSLKEKWKNLSKKKKVAIIVSTIIILAAIIILIVFLLTNKKEEEPPKKEEPVVIVEKDNYIYKDGILTFLDEDENEIGTYKCKNKDESLCFVADYSLEDNFDIPKNTYEDESTINERSIIYNNKYVFVFDNEKDSENNIILYNIKEEKSEGDYTLLKGFSDSNYVILKDKNNMYGAIEFTDTGIKEKIKFEQDYLGRINKDSNLVGKANNKYFIYDEEGNVESKGMSSEIKSYNDKYLAVDSGGYTLYDYDGKEILDDAYDYLYLLEEYVLAIDKNKIYIRDYQNNKYNEDGIKLENNNYNPINIYDKDKKLIETKKAFLVEASGTSIEIKTYEGERENSYQIDANEGILSNKLKYISYFNGKLYFYSDDKKTDLIGSYSCTNKNSVGPSTKNLSNCFVAKDSFYSKNDLEINNSSNIGTIPIFNETFVFITDTIDKKKSSIVLYDLKNSRVLSKYETVDTGSYTKKDEITFKNTDNALIMAKNTSSKYGMIKISSREAKSAIAFKYDSLEKFNEYYLAMTKNGRDNSYILLDEKGKEITKPCEYKIVNYYNEYLVTTNDNKYYIYNFLGNNIDPTGYNYIALYDDYYVVVTTENKLDIHEYNRPYNLKTQVAINTNDYKNAFQVYKVNDGYTVKLIKGGEFHFDGGGNLQD